MSAAKAKGPTATERREAEKRKQEQQERCEYIRTYLARLYKSPTDVCQTGYHRLLGNWVSWDIDTAEALVFVRHLRPGQEALAIHCHERFLKSATAQFEQNGCCHEELAHLCESLCGYLQAANYFYRAGKRDAQWVAVSADNPPRQRRAS